MLNRHLNVFLSENKLNLLDIRSYRNGYLWECEKTNFFGVCLRCGSVNVVRAGKTSSLVREEPVEGVWPGRRSTQRFRKFIAKACSNMTDLKRVSDYHSVSHGFAYQVYYEQVEVKLKEYQSASHWPEVVGIDEHFFRRKRGRSEFVTMVTDLRKKRVFEMVQGKDHQSLKDQLAHIPGRHRVKVVVIDMSSTYKSFVKKFFPNAVIIADKFHVLRLFTPSIMKAGKEIHGHRKELKTRRKLLCSRKNLDYFVRVEIDQYLKQHGKLNELYRFKEKLFEFYRIKGFRRAVGAFSKLLKEMEGSPHEEIQRLLRTFKRWKDEILRYFEKGYTNGFTERMNGTGKLVQRRAFGYKSFRNYRLRALSACLFKGF